MERDSVCAYVLGVIPLSPSMHLYTFWMTPPSFPYLCTYLLDGLFLNQKTNQNIRKSYSLKYKHSKKKILYKKIIHSVRWNKHSREQHNVSYLCEEATFLKKNSCLVARIVSFDTVKSWNSIFWNSEFFLLTRMFTT